jgi:hypothetical protein
MLSMQNTGVTENASNETYTEFTEEDKKNAVVVMDLMGLPEPTEPWTSETNECGI